MRECDLYPPVRDWLVAQGYEVHVEIFGADIVALKDGAITAVELKTFFSEGLVRQLRDRTKWADFVIAATPGKIDGPRRLDFRNGLMQTEGFGFLVVDGAIAHQLIEPRQQTGLIDSRKKYRLRRLAGRKPAMPHELAGLPSCPALREQRRLRDT